MEIGIGKISSLIIAVVILLAIVISSGQIGSWLLTPCAYLVFCLSLIWFPETFGSFTGYVGRGSTIDSETPPEIVTGLGWVFLIGLPLWVILYGS